MFCNVLGVTLVSANLGVLAGRTLDCTACSCTAQGKEASLHSPSYDFKNDFNHPKITESVTKFSSGVAEVNMPNPVCISVLSNAHRNVYNFYF